MKFVNEYSTAVESRLKDGSYKDISDKKSAAKFGFGTSDRK